MFFTNQAIGRFYFFVSHAFIFQHAKMSPSTQSSETIMNKTLLDEREVSIVTGVPTKTLQYWRFAGTSHAPKFIKLGTRVYCLWQDLEKWVAERPSFSSATQAKHQGTG